MKNFIYPLLLPNGLLCAIVLYFLAQTRLPAGIQPFLQVFPFAVVFIGILLGWRFNRTRLIFAIGLLVLADFAVRFFAEGASAALVLQSTALLLPANLLLVSWFRERGLLNLRCLMWLLFLSAEIGAVGGLIHYRPTLLGSYLSTPLLQLNLLTDVPLSQPVLLTNGLVLLILAARSLCRPGAFESAFFWAQVILFAGFSGLGGQPLRLFMASAGLILIMGLMETSHSLAYRDELTRLPGRRALNEALPKLGNRYTLAMLDIDHFKKFNDTYGHHVGDQVLKMVAAKLASASGSGKVYRFGGEEFTVIFARRSLKETLPYLEGMRQTVENARFIPRGKDRPKKKPKKLPRAGNRQNKLKVTISVGAAEPADHLISPADVIKAADVALYKAKKSGRNQVRCYSAK